ncbi:ABC transporter permease [Cetobacterium somerae]|uniref:ABC transporter permease n=1 Tax=Cetobacterium somerae TaxID=188913 RepID=UPI00211F0E45|nr:ABC transporter permease [Cetobacterium somerae]MCQ9626750.1 ABC transporter permease [Cetobacterium somerae]
MAQDIFLPNLLYFAIFLIPIFYIMNYLEINMISNVIKSILRMFIQLMLVGVYLHYILTLNNSWINLAYLTLMTFACTFTIVRDVKIRDSKFYIIVAVSTIIPLILNMFIFSELLLHLKDPLDALYLIPISGMILGNTLNGMIVTINDFLNNLKLNEESKVDPMSRTF